MLEIQVFRMNPSIIQRFAEYLCHCVKKHQNA